MITSQYLNPIFLHPAFPRPRLNSNPRIKITFYFSSSNVVGLTRAEQFSVIEISRNTSYLLFFFFSRTQFFWQCQIGLTYARRRNNNYVRLELYDVDVTGRFGITLLYLYMENTHETTGVEDGRMVSACTRLPEASV